MNNSMHCMEVIQTHRSVPTHQLRALCAASLMVWAGVAAAQEPVRIGYISDLSSVYSDVEGKGGAVALQMAIDDFGGKVLGRPIELLVADHQNKADVAASKAREWFDQRDLQMLVGGTTTSAALAMARVADEKKRVVIVNGSGAAALTNEQCSPYTIHYAYDLVALARGTGNAVVEQGGKSWFFLTADYSFGHELQKNTSQVVAQRNGVVNGSAKHPLNASDFSSFVMQAKDSKAQILAFANAGGDFINVLRFRADASYENGGYGGIQLGHPQPWTEADAGLDVYRQLVLGSEPGEPRICRSLPEKFQEDADLLACR